MDQSQHPVSQYMCAVLLQLLPRLAYLLIASHAPEALGATLSLLHRTAVGGSDYCQEILASPGLTLGLQGVLESAAPHQAGDLMGQSLWANRHLALGVVCVLAESSPSAAHALSQQGEGVVGVGGWV